MDFMIPEVWHEFGQYIHQDFLEQFPDFRSGVSDFACSLSESKYNDFSSFVVGVIQSDASASELSVVWEASGASFYVDEHEMPILFNEIATALNECVPDS